MNRKNILTLGILALVASFAAVIVSVVFFTRLPAEWLVGLCSFSLCVAPLVFSGAVIYFGVTKPLD
jgi:hypothetical protein